MSDARSAVRRASSAVEEVRSRVPALASQMAWSSRSVRQFTEAFDAWAADLDRLCDRLARWEHDLERAERSGPSGGITGFRPFGAPVDGGQAER